MEALRLRVIDPMQKPTLRSFWLPVGLAMVTLVVLNLGLYLRLSSLPAQASEPLGLPYREDFATLDSVFYEIFGGDWDIRDETLVQLSTSGFDLAAFVPVEMAPGDSYEFEASMQFLGGNMGGGLIFNAQQTTSRQQSHMARFNVDGAQLWLIYGYFGDDSNFMGQGSVALSIAPDDATVHRLGVQVDAGRYTLLLDGEVLAEGIPLSYEGGAVGLISATSQVAFDDLSIAPLPETPGEAAPDTIAEAAPSTPASSVGALAFSDGFENPAGGASLWQPLSGTWAFADGTYQQTQLGGFDFTSIYQQPVQTPMTYSVTFTQTEGAGAGLVFNLPQPTLRDGGHLVRYVESGDVITWGYYDEDGRFNGQGSAEVPPAGTSEHTLSVTVSESTYAVRLDGTQLIAGIPLNETQTNSYIGLTASQTVVAFDEIRVTAAEDMITGDANINPAVASGTWTQTGDTIIQTDTELTDYIVGTGLAGEAFTISVDVTLPEDAPDAGGGLVFHMAGRDEPYPGYMVRFDAEEIFWGEYDVAGVFDGAGSVPLDLDSEEAYMLQLVVRAASYDITINEARIVEDIPIALENGWIGLVSFSGPVSFSNIRLELGE